MPHKLLLADDSVTIQRVIELTFADEDITVVAVGDGRQAIERVQTDRPDIVLADVGMPERDGYEVAAFVKGTPSLAHIPVLLLTGAFEPIDEARAEAAGCDGVLVKPFEPQMVISRVKDLIAGRRPVQKLPAPQSLPPTDTTHGAAPVPAADAGVLPATVAASGSVDEYFDRLDAAFATLENQPPPRAESSEVRRPATLPVVHSGLGHELAHWHPDLDARPDEADSDHFPREDAQPAAPVATSVAAAPSPLPTLAEAFAALLQAEAGRTVTAASVSVSALDDELIEQVTRRVIERLGDRMVRDVVIEVAERLVADEIARIKAAAR